jgi:hypothetical protein
MPRSCLFGQLFPLCGWRMTTIHDTRTPGYHESWAQSTVVDSSPITHVSSWKTSGLSALSADIVRSQ